MDIGLLVHKNVLHAVLFRRLLLDMASTLADPESRVIFTLGLRIA